MEVRSIMKKIFLLVVSVTLLLLLTCCNSGYEPVKPFGEPLYKSIVVIGMDGAGGMFKDGDTLTDGFRSFFATEDSSIGFRYKCEKPSESGANWGSYLHGVSPFYHGKILPRSY